ncbi:SGNH/GDSL hydrolase family protein [Kribbella sp. NPDC051586]|uniref:SGNH/GDSL hydrolase family protein n=1 Tax=Kribbella sp. NPDC051586 TaxID=3364118 RepID=UPI0037951FBD
MLTTEGDAAGFHILVADEKDGYAWRTAATLREPGVDADQWVGQACMTESTRRAVVVYAPRGFANDPVLSLRGAFAAVVDLDSGQVRRLPTRTSLAYFNPGCGSGESAVLTQEGDDSLPGTRLTRVDATTGRLAKPVLASIQVSSAVPTASGIVGAASNALVSVANTGKVRGIVRAAGTPFDLTVDANGAVVHSDHVGTTVRVRRTSGRLTDTVGTGPLQAVNVQRGGHGTVYVTGKVTTAKGAAKLVTLLPDVTPIEGLSSAGHLVLSPQAKAPATSSTTPSATVELAGRVPATGRSVNFTVPIQAESAAVAPMDDPVDDGHTCAIPRNDVNQLVYQPTPRQAEWAVDQAVRHALTVSRPFDWHHDGIGGYTPQGLFPAPGLSGGGFIPAQIMLGITAQESNMSQASWHAMSGEYGNPLVGDYYGNKSQSWGIDFSKADCGYGISQVTDGMRLADTKLTSMQKTAVALDYATNIAAGVQILEQKWNELYSHGMLVNGGDPQWIENWYLALWAYNSGYHPLGDPKTDGTVSGLGWLNNPANPRYPQDRLPFLEYTYSDAAHPQNWPYQEKVIGWAGHPIDTLDGTGYRPAWWLTVDDRRAAQPPPKVLCTEVNECTYGATFPPNDPDVVGEPAGPCHHKSPAGLYNLQCYWHTSVSWRDCASGCGHEVERFDPGQYPEQPAGTHYPPAFQCGTGPLPANTIIVDDLPSSVPSLSCPSKPPSAGTFSMTFGTGAEGQHPSKIDLHQLGGGLGGHFWFAHTWAGSPAMQVTGTWTPTTRLSGWTRVLVHVPDHGAMTQQAHYVIHLGNGGTENRYIPTDIEANTWVNLGVFNFVSGSDTPRLVLDNVSPDGDGSSDVAWDAAAFSKLPGKPRDIVVQLGDSYSSGQGVGAYEDVSNRGLPTAGNGADTGTPSWNACRRSRSSWARKAVLPGSASTVGSRTDTNDPSLDYHSVACSAALTYNIDPDLGREEPGHLGQHHEVPQLESGFLDSNTTLVALTIGGNDIGFTQVLESCSIAAPGNCPAYEDLLPTIDKLAGPLTAVLDAIRIKAPNAQIVLLGYPRLFAPQTPDDCSTVVGTQDERHRLNQWADYLSTVEEHTVAAYNLNRPSGSPAAKYHFPGPEFSGHELCNPQPTTQYALNDLVAAPHGGPSDFTCPGNPICASMESFHPNDLGSTLYAQAFQNALTS